MIDPKPLGAFIEYSLRPAIEDTVEVLNRMESLGLNPKDALRSVWKLYLFDKITSMVTQFIVTGALCFTILNCLRTTK